MQCKQAAPLGMGDYDPEAYDPKLKVDSERGFRATSLNLLSVQRPHMRSFHFSWFSFFIAFLGWFAFAPLSSVLRDDLDLRDSDIWRANVCSVSSTVAARFVVGPLCDRFGPKRVQALLLLFCSLCTFLAPLVTTADGLITIRFFIGVVGSTFVCTQYWSSIIFVPEVVGTAQGISGGWGNLGGGVTQIFMAGLYEGMRGSGADPGQAWRLAMVVPAVLLGGTALAVLFLSDDCPRGDYAALVREGAKERVKPLDAAIKGYSSAASWLLAAQYAACFGVELTVNNTLTEYFRDRFDLSLVRASAIASSFGLMNLFARACGGILSDRANAIYGLRGRQAAQFLALIGEAVTLFIFSLQDRLSSAIPFLLLFSFFVQVAEGTTFAMVPYVVPSATGSVAGIVGAGGNIGAIVWGLIFLYTSMSTAGVLRIISYAVVFLSLLTPWVFARQTSGYEAAKKAAPAEHKAEDL